jgi:hypothetical protein
MKKLFKLITALALVLGIVLLAGNPSSQAGGFITTLGFPGEGGGGGGD